MPDPTETLHDVEILKIGAWASALSGRVQVTDADIADMLAASQDDLGLATRSMVSGVKFRNCQNYAVRQNNYRTDGAVMLHTIDGCDIDGGLVGISLTSAATTATRSDAVRDK